MTESDSSNDLYQSLPLDQEQIKKIIPHRDPILLVDEVLELTQTTAVATRFVDKDEVYFKGHFPGNPIMPGVLIVEAMAQVMGVVLLAKPDNRGKLGYFASINQARFREIVRPGDTLRFEVEITKEKKRFCTGVGKAIVGDKVACEAELMLFVAENEG